MSDHIDDSTTDEEIQATVMRDKVRAKKDTPPAETGRHTKECFENRFYRKLGDFWGGTCSCPAAEPVSPEPPRKVDSCPTYKSPHACPTDHISESRPDLFCQECGRLLPGHAVLCKIGLREAGTVSATPEPEERMLKAWSSYRGPVNDDAAAFEAGFQAGLASQSLPSPAPQVETVVPLSDWNALLLELSKLYSTIDPEWADAAADQMDEFDPWKAIRELLARAASPAQPVGTPEKEKV